MTTVPGTIPLLRTKPSSTKTVTMIVAVMIPSSRTRLSSMMTDMEVAMTTMKQRSCVMMDTATTDTAETMALWTMPLDGLGIRYAHLRAPHTKDLLIVAV